MKETQNNIKQEDFKSLFDILDDVIDLQRLIAKTYAASVALYESFDSNRDFSARVGDKVLADAVEVICDYSREADKFMTEIHNNLNILHDYYNSQK